MRIAIIDLDTLLETLSKYCPEYWDELLEELPTLDAVPVVRCKDCKHSGRIYSTGGYIDCAYSQRLHEPDFFCADGKRKDGADDEAL